ncbi:MULTISPECIES: hypothetical protein [Vibrio]|uniref:hypothetical protein n=1 Tax=Vibrio TaxID=662 RepID=UPI002074D22F|nr:MULTISPECIES: hypothetical protein [Vibrio]USD33646.1 hypothetical protein J8Z27_05945 [Vibrio sp. SCSIO 43186]USD46714.1 hypothetical protein J4N38_06120 [Vibrio sp. SCSIO 43145]USD70771.1 hypothetical protein J4N41_05945 [Vibrio sp. SCSIO 43139]
MNKINLFLLTYLLPSLTLASETSETTIKRVLSGPEFGKQVLITVDTNPSSLPECHTNQWYNYVFDGTTPEGQMTLSLVLTAYAAQKTVVVSGTNSCTLRGGVENLKYILAK